LKCINSEILKARVPCYIITHRIIINLEYKNTFYLNLTLCSVHATGLTHTREWRARLS